MKNFLAATTLIASVLLFLPISIVNARSDDYVTICHNGETISIDHSALQALLNQGATLGPCPSTSVPEFGFATGAVAVLGAGVAYLALKKNFAH